MKRGVIVLILASVIALVGYGVFYNCATAHSRAMLNSPQGELEWLREEFVLNDTQFATIKELHAAHVEQCKELCLKLDASNAKVLHLTASSNEVTPAIRDALNAVAGNEAQCREAMLAHVFEIAAHISVEHRQRYIDMMMHHVAPANAAHHELM